MSQVLADPAEAQAAVEALLTLCTGLLETAIEIVGDIARDDHLDELAMLCADLDLFARAAVRAKTYQC